MEGGCVCQQYWDCLYSFLFLCETPIWTVSCQSCSLVDSGTVLILFTLSLYEVSLGMCDFVPLLCSGLSAGLLNGFRNRAREPDALLPVAGVLRNGGAVLLWPSVTKLFSFVGTASKRSRDELFWCFYRDWFGNGYTIYY